MFVAIITLIIAIITVFNHSFAWLLVLFPGIYILYAFFAAFSRAPKLKNTLHLTYNEKQAWKKYHSFLRYPFATKNMSSALSIMQFISVLIAVAFACTGALWGLLFALGWIVLGLPTTRLNPLTTFVTPARKGDLAALKELESIDSLRTKLNS